MARVIDLNQQIQCVRREIAMRQSAYPRWVKEGRMKQAKATEEIEAMQAVESTLVELINNQEFKLS